MHLKYSRLALRDLSDIYTYTELHFGVQQADTYLEGFVDVDHVLRDYPQIGKIYEAKHLDRVKRFSSGSHQIYYRVVDNTILVGRILHKSMDVEDILDMTDFQ